MAFNYNNALSLLVLLCLSFFLSISGTAVDSISTTTSAAATDFIRSKCSVTTYPSLCVQSLAVHGPTTQSNPKQLAKTALTVSLQKAQLTKALVGKLAISRGLRPREYAALNDCKKVTSDGVYRLQQSIGEFKYIDSASGEELLWHISNVQTWVSSVLTDGTTCTDGFAGKAMDGRIKSLLNAQVTNMCHVTSNALALINQLAGNY